MSDHWDAPVGTAEERAGVKLWPGAWFDATGFNVPYPPAMQRADYHTGADLNCNAPVWNADAHAPVYACASGIVVFADLLPVWGKVIVVKHFVEGTCLWSRYAHLEKMIVAARQVVVRGDQIGTIGNAEGRMAWHLHFDIARIDLGVRPGDWPNTDRARLVRDYCNPLEYLKAHHQ